MAGRCSHYQALSHHWQISTVSSCQNILSKKHAVRRCDVTICLIVTCGAGSLITCKKFLRTVTWCDVTRWCVMLYCELALLDLPYLALPFLALLNLYFLKLLSYFFLSLSSYFLNSLLNLFLTFLLLYSTFTFLALLNLSLSCITLFLLSYPFM